MKNINDGKKIDYPYVRFETKLKEFSGQEGGYEDTTGEFILRLDSAAGNVGNVNHYLDKGYKILDFGNFQRISEDGPITPEHAQIERRCREVTETSKSHAAETSAMQKRIDELEAEVQKKDKGK